MSVPLSPERATWKCACPQYCCHTAVLAVELLTNDHQQDEGFNFDAPYSEDAFDLNLEAADHQQELQQMISKPQRNLIFFLTISLLK